VPCYVRLQELTGPSTASSVIIPIPNPDLGMDQFAVQSGEPVIQLLRPERLGIKGYGGSRHPSPQGGRDTMKTLGDRAHRARLRCCPAGPEDSRTNQVWLREVQTTELRSCSEVERPVEGGDIFIAAR
jgi:hypothetical protein